MRALLPAELLAPLAPWLDRLEAELSARGAALERCPLSELPRPTPALRRARAQALTEDCGPDRLELLLGGERLPLEIHAALARSQAPMIALSPSLDTRAPDDSLPPSDAHPPAGLAAAIAHSLTPEPRPLDPAGDVADLAAELCAAHSPRRVVDRTDLVAAALRAEEDYRKLALWSRDLADQAADLERGRGPTTAWRAIVRRARRFLRKRGLA